MVLKYMCTIDFGIHFFLKKKALFQWFFVMIDKVINEVQAIVQARS